MKHLKEENATLKRKLVESEAKNRQQNERITNLQENLTDSQCLMASFQADEPSGALEETETSDTNYNCDNSAHEETDSQDMFCAPSPAKKPNNSKYFPNK